VTCTAVAGTQAVSPQAVGDRINRVIPGNKTPNGFNIPAVTSWQGTTANPILVSNGIRGTNYSGPSTTFGNIVSLATGSCNVLYPAVARSFNSADDALTQLTEGAFTNPTALGATPSMIISFADCSGGFGACDTPAAGVGGGLPIADG